jgi:hypothetical protein
MLLARDGRYEQASGLKQRDYLVDFNRANSYNDL